MKRGIGVREFSVKINNENARFFKGIVDEINARPVDSFDHKFQIESAKAFSGYITKYLKSYGPGKLIMLLHILSDMQSYRIEKF